MLQALATLNPPFSCVDHLLYEEAVLRLAMLAKHDALPIRERLRQIAVCATAIATVGRADLVGGLLMACGRAAMLLSGGGKLCARIWKMVSAWDGQWGVRTVVGALETGMWIGTLGTVHQKEMALVMRAVLEGMNRGKSWHHVAVLVLERGLWEEMFTMIEVSGAWQPVLEAVASVVRSRSIEDVHIALAGSVVGKKGRVAEQARTTLAFCLDAEEKAFGGNGEGSSSGRKWAVLRRAIRMIGKVEEGGSVLNVLEGIVWKEGELGRSLLYEAFVWVGAWRKRIVKGIMVGLMGGCQDFCALLEHICAWAGVREVGEEIIALLDCVESLQWECAAKVIRAIVGASMSVPAMREKVWRFLKKNVGTRGSKMQCVVCSGLLAILRVQGQDEEVRGMLERMFDKAGVGVRRYFIKITIDLLSVDTERTEQVRQLADIPLKRLREIERNKSADSPAFDFSKTFEMTKSGWLVRDDLPLLLMLCSKILGTERGVDSLFSRLLEYVACVDGALRDACILDVDKAPVCIRIKQLCSVFEAVTCIDTAHLSVTRVTLYAFALLLRDYLASPKSLSAVDAVRKVDAGQGPSGTSEDHSLALLTVEEASDAKCIVGCAEEDSWVSVPMSNYLKALGIVIEVGMEALPAKLVLAELLNVICTRLDKRYCWQKKNASFLTDNSELLDLAKQCFIKSYAWNAFEEVSGDDMAVTKNIRESDEPINSGIQQIQDSKLFAKKFKDICQKVACEAEFDEEIKKATSSKRLGKLSATTSLTIREFAMRIMLSLLDDKGVSKEWFDMFQFMEELSVKGHVTNACQVTLPHEQGEKQNCEIEVRTINAIVKVLHLEFEHSLSIALTLLYLDLLTKVLNSLHGNDQRGPRVREIISSAINVLLREYSIRHIRVLKGMVTIVLNAYDIGKALKFGVAVIKWLGNESCLLNSEYVSQDNVRIGVEDFDADILEEAIYYDLERESDQEAGTSDHLEERNGEIQESSAQTEDSFGQEKDSPAILKTRTRDRSENTDQIKSLCLNETAESALLSIECVLGYCSTRLHATLDLHRREAREGLIAESCDASLISGVVSVLQELFHSPFAELKSSRALRASLSLGRKVGAIFQSLCEIADLQLRMAMTMLRSSSKDHGLTFLVDIIRVILDFILDTTVMAQVQAFMRDSDHSMRLTFLLEKLESTVTAFLLCVAKRPMSNLKDFCDVLQRHTEKINCREYKVNESQLSQVFAKSRSRGNKRRRIRSRNRDVDGWLRDESGDDDYADLEDFVVPLDETDL